MWKLAASEARLDFAGLLATIDLTRPELGLCDVRYRGRRLKSTALLGIAMQGLPASGPPAEVDAYVQRLLSGHLAPPSRKRTFASTIWW